MMFPRSFEGGAERKMQVSVGTSKFGPIPLPSPVRENTKFMNILRLYDMRDHPEQGRSVQQLLLDFVSRDQQDQYLQQLAYELNNGARRIELAGDMGLVHRIQNTGAIAEVRKRQLFIRAHGTELVRYTRSRNGDTAMSATAEEVRIKSIPRTSERLIELVLVMHGYTVGEDARHRDFEERLFVSMPADIQALMSRPASAYVTNSAGSQEATNLRQKLKKLQNSAISEIHARLSFAISCFILVMVGCTLGMMFRSGNFLSAFAISVVPALLSIALVVTGQHTAEIVTREIGNPNWNDPLNLGIALIYSGNAVVFLVGAVLLGRLQRQ
jgi:hypothetical protein